jgi:hypothetical protein
MTVIHVLYVQDEHGWYAQCLDYDIGAQGNTLDEAERAFFRTWQIQVTMDRAHGREPFEGLGKAPDKYWQMLKEASEWTGRQAPPDDSGEIRQPPAFVIAAQVERMSSLPRLGK